MLSEYKLDFLENIYAPKVVIYKSDSMYVYVPKATIDFFAGDHYHDGYEFLIPLDNMPYVIIDGKEIFGYKNSIIPINPNQRHGTLKNMPQKHLLDIIIDGKFVDKVSMDVFGIDKVLFKNGCYKMKDNTKNIIDMFIREAKLNIPGKYLLLQSLCSYITISIIRDIDNNIPGLGEKITDMDNIRVKHIIDYINNNYKEKCSLKYFADEININLYYLIRLFKNKTGKTPHEYLIDVRLEHAKVLLSSGNMSILQVCLECGFNNMSHFTSLFKKRVGITPSSYRSRFVS